METGNQGLGKKSHLAYFVKSKIFHDLLIVVFVENATYQDITVFEKIEVFAMFLNFFVGFSKNIQRIPSQKKV